MSTEVDQQPDAASAPALAGLAVCTVFSGEPAQLALWCNFHLNSGADRLYVVLDRPSSDVLAALPSLPGVHWHPVQQHTWDAFYPRGSQNAERKQVDAFRLMARRALSEGHDLLAFVDSDELVHLSEPFVTLAERLPDAQAFAVPVHEMWFDAGDSLDTPFGATLALQPSSPREVDWKRAFGWRAQFLSDGVLGHHRGRTVYRLPLCSGEIGVHGPRSGRLAAAHVSLPREAAMLLRYDSGSLVTWNRAWLGRLGGDTVGSGLEPHRAAQQRLFAHVLRQRPEQQAEFFRLFYSLGDAAQDRLRTAGVLQRVDVAAQLEGPVVLGGPSADSEEVRLGRLPEVDARVDFQFALVCDKRFVKPTFATMTSVLSHVGRLGSVRFVVLGDGLDPADTAWLRRLEHTDHDVRVVVHDITHDLDRDVGTGDPKRATFGRIYLIDHLPPQRTVYLDGDVLATRDFTEIFRLDLHGACLAGVSDSAALRLVANPEQVPIQQRNRLMGITRGDALEYLNGGVLVFDLDNPDFRTLALQARMLVVMQGGTLEQRDQDAMNIAFAGRKHRLPSTYNYMTQFYLSDRCLDGNLVQLKYQAADASLVHFSGRTKPWESPEEEFYNGLYRRLVAEAEQRVGVSCGLYFSKRPSVAHRGLSAGQWAELLAAAPERETPAERRADLEVLTLWDGGGYVRLTPEMYEHAVATGLRLLGSAEGLTIFDVPLRLLGPQELHLAERAGSGVRRLPFDLVESLRPFGGVARRVDLALVAPDGSEGDYVRHLGVLDMLVAGTSAVPSHGARGAADRFADGCLSGWCLAPEPGNDPTLSFYINDELVALRPANLRRGDVHESGRAAGFRVNVARLRSLGYGAGASVTEVSVRVACTNVPLRGTPVTISDLAAEGVYDEARGQWDLSVPRRPSLLRRVRARLSSTIGR